VGWEGEALPNESAAYVTRYRGRMTSVSGSPEAFGKAYPVAMRVWPLGVRGF